jgi:hypothetical protein
MQQQPPPKVGMREAKFIHHSMDSILHLNFNFNPKHTTQHTHNIPLTSVIVSKTAFKASSDWVLVMPVFSATDATKSAFLKLSTGAFSALAAAFLAAGAFLAAAFLAAAMFSSPTMYGRVRD